MVQQFPQVCYCICVDKTERKEKTVTVIYDRVVLCGEYTEDTQAFVSLEAACECWKNDACHYVCADLYCGEDYVWGVSSLSAAHTLIETGAIIHKDAQKPNNAAPQYENYVVCYDGELSSTELYSDKRIAETVAASLAAEHPTIKFTVCGVVPLASCTTTVSWEEC